MNYKKAIGTLAIGMSLLLGTFAAAVEAPPTTGTITIPIKEYTELTESMAAAKEDQYWNMTFTQILDKEGNNYIKAWAKYKFWNLRRIDLNSAVNPASAATLIRQIEVLNMLDSERPITIIINSPGGSVLAGFNILNAMNDSAAPVNTVCDGWAMSMSAVILSNGVHREANQNCIFMIHEAAAGAPGGQTTKQMKWTEAMINVENILAITLAENSGLSVKDVRAAWELETFYNAYETVLLGFADEVTSETKAGKIIGSHAIPDDLLPRNKMRDTFNERLTK